MRKAKLEGDGSADHSVDNEKAKLEGDASPDHSEEHFENPEVEFIKSGDEDRSELVATVATVAVVGIGAAVFEAALLPGIVLGAAAVYVPQFLPQIGAALNPLFRSTVRGAYKIGEKTREMVAEAQEQGHDIVAEVDAERNVDPTATKAPINKSSS
jgi:hypothetical protein